MRAKTGLRMLILLMNVRCQNASCTHDTKLLEVTTKIMAHVFLLERCLCVISDRSLVGTLVEKSLVNLGSPSIFLEPEQDHLLANDFAICQGYIVASSDALFLRKTFKKRAGVFPFRVNRKILIFFEGVQDFYRPPFSTAVNLQGVYLFVAQGYHLFQLEGKEGDVQNTSWNGKRDFEANHSLECKGAKRILDVQKSSWDGERDFEAKQSTIEILDVQKRKTLASWDGESDFELDILDFEVGPWRPNFDVSKGAKFVASAFNCTPFVFVDSNRQVYDGVEHRILQEIAKSWRFEYKVHDYNFDQDLYDDVITDVLNGTSDLAMCSHWRFFAVRSDMDISYPYTQVCMTFLVPKPLLLSNWTFVFQPIANSLWAITVVSVFVASLSLWASEKLRRKIVDDTTEYLCYTSSVLNTLRILSLNSVTHFPTPSQIGLRFILTSWCLICVILSTGYSAGYSSLLTYPRFYRHINNLDDMVEENIQWGAPEMGMRDYYESSGLEILTKIARQFTYDHSIANILEKIRKNTHSIIVKVLPKRYVADTDFLDDYAKTHLKILPGCFEIQYLVFPLAKNSPYTKLFEENIQRFYEHGLITFWYASVREKYDWKYMRNFYTTLAEPIPKEYVSFKVDKIKGALFFLLGGLSIAFLTFILELNFATFLTERIIN